MREFKISCFLVSTLWPAVRMLCWCSLWLCSLSFHLTLIHLKNLGKGRGGKWLGFPPPLVLDNFLYCKWNWAFPWLGEPVWNKKHSYFSITFSSHLRSQRYVQAFTFSSHFNSPFHQIIVLRDIYLAYFDTLSFSSLFQIDRGGLISCLREGWYKGQSQITYYR
jgi:hypothetical protein